MKGVTSSKSGGGGASKKDKKEHQQTGTSDKSGGNVGQRQRDERQEQSQADHELFLQAFESKRLCTYSTHILLNCTRLETAKNAGTDLV